MTTLAMKLEEEIGMALLSDCRVDIYGIVIKRL